MTLAHGLVAGSVPAPTASAARGDVVWQPAMVDGDELVEITDLLVEHGPDGQRAPVRRDDVVQTCEAHGDRWGARIARALPARDGVLDEDEVDRLRVAVHCEIQRLSEEFRHGARMWSHLRPVLAALRTAGRRPPYRVVDVGCGTGYVVRWLAANVDDPDLEVVGVDLDDVLVHEGRRLAAAEDLPCRFEVGDAFALDEPADVFVSTGVLHHLRGPDLERTFAAHERSAAAAFVHVDFQPSAIAPVGAWLFHRTRMRLALSRHDGIRSAQRSHDPDHLLQAATVSAPSFTTGIWGRRVRHTPFPCVLTSLIGVRSELRSELVEALGRRADRWEVPA